MTAPNNPVPDQEPVRPHTFDGIQEYDKRLPNWWLFTLYGAIVFSLVYWLYFHQSQVGISDHERLTLEMERIQAERLRSSLGAIDDPRLWEMSRNTEIVSAGRQVFLQNCTPCHLASLRGKSENPTAVGPNLVDEDWIHGGAPSAIRNTITRGVLEKGMPAWGPMLGDKKIIEVLAFVLSHHQPPAAVAATTAVTP